RMARRGDDERSLGEVHGRPGVGTNQEGDGGKVRQPGRRDPGPHAAVHAVLAAAYAVPRKDRYRYFCGVSQHALAGAATLIGITRRTPVPGERGPESTP